MSQDKKYTKQENKMPSKQIFAIIGIILLVLLYVVTLFAAIFDSSASHALFATCLLATVAHPSSHLDLPPDVWKTDKPLHLRRLPSGRNRRTKKNSKLVAGCKKPQNNKFRTKMFRNQDFLYGISFILLV